MLGSYRRFSKSVSSKAKLRLVESIFNFTCKLVVVFKPTYLLQSSDVKGLKEATDLNSYSAFIANYNNCKKTNNFPGHSLVKKELLSEHFLQSKLKVLFDNRLNNLCNALLICFCLL